MNLQEIIKNLHGCSCGKEHTLSLKVVEIESDIVSKVGTILKNNGFPKRLLLVADNNSLKVSKGLLQSLFNEGFIIEMRVYDNMRVASMEEVVNIETLSKKVEGILSVGTGSVNDICRLAAYRQNKEFAIFATAPSMDGFASGTSPIINNNFKFSYQAKQPSIIIADTKILAKAPVELKAAGFGDIIGKFTGLVDWKISNILTGEYYCENIANLTRMALDKVIALADKVYQEDEETVAAIMEALVFTGMAMHLAGCTRPASGTEHILSHFWEIKKLECGEEEDYHGKTVGVATVMICDVYKKMAEVEEVRVQKESLDWEKIKEAYGPNLSEDMMKLNNPTVTEEVNPEKLQRLWPEIRRIVQQELPDLEELVSIMKRANAPTTIGEIGVSKKLADLGLEYHPFMRYRITLMRLRYMLNL